MKKNYLLMTVLGSLVLSGCTLEIATPNKPNTNSSNSNSSNVGSSLSSSSSSSSSSSTSQDDYMTVAEAVAEIENSYTVNYSVDGVKSSTKYHQDVFFSEYSQDGYYFVEDTVYYVYLQGDRTPVYSEQGDLEAYLEEENFAAALRLQLDLAANFTAAEWEFVEVTNDNEVIYVTTDELVVATANLLTDYQHENDIYYVEAIVSEDDEQIAGFVTKTQDGEVLAEASLGRFGTSNPLGGAYRTPVKSEDLDPSLVNAWVIYANMETNIGGAGTVLEITADGKLYVPTYDAEGKPISYDVYSYVMPSGLGQYLFTNAAGDVAMFEVWFNDYGDIYFETLPAGGSSADVQYNIAVSYYTLLFFQAAEMEYARIEKGVYYVEKIAVDDEEYSVFVTEIDGAVAAYRVYDGATLEDSSTYIIVTQFATIEKLMFALGVDEELYNGYAMFGMSFWNNFAVTGYESADDTILFENIAYLLPPTFVAPNIELYPVANQGESLIDYLVKYYVETLGFSYVNKDTVTEESQYKSTIDDLLASYSNLGEGKPSIQDVYIFYGQVSIEGTVYSMYVAVGVFDMYDMDNYFSHGVSNTAILSGYLMVCGGALNASLTWAAYQAYYESL